MHDPCTWCRLQLDDTLPGQAYVQALADLISSIQQDINHTKQLQRKGYAALVSEEQQLEQQLCATLDAFDSWEAAAHTNSAADTPPHHRSAAAAAGQRPTTAPGSSTRSTSASR
jgi:hypothetical protein